MHPKSLFVGVVKNNWSSRGGHGFLECVHCRARQPLFPLLRAVRAQDSWVHAAPVRSRKGSSVDNPNTFTAGGDRTEFGNAY